jgi:UDP-glucose 4-epimerase
MYFDILFIGFGKITNSIISKFINEKISIGVISTHVTSKEINSYSFSGLSILNWEDVLATKICSKTTYISWRSPLIETKQNLAINSWLESNNFETKRIFHLSSSSVYPDSKFEHFEKDFQPNPLNSSNPKQKLELLLNFLAERKNCKLINLRISNVYGGDLTHGFINESIINTRNHRSISAYLKLNPVRDYILLDDLTEAIRQLWQINLSSQNLNLSTGHGTSIKSILQIFEPIFNENYKIKLLDSPNNMQKYCVLNCEKLKEIISWDPKLIQTTLPLILSNT